MVTFNPERPLTLLAAVITTLLAVSHLTHGRPETNFASSSIASDGSGTRSTQLVGTVPNSGYGSGVATRYGGSNGGSGGGVSVVSGGGSGYSGQTGGAVFTGSSTSGGGGSGDTVGIFSRSGPSGTQHTVITPQGTKTYSQPAGSGSGVVVGRIGPGASPNYGTSYGGVYTYPYGSGYYNDHYDDYDGYGYGSNPYRGAGTFAGAGPASAGTYSGAGGAFASAGAGGIGTFAGAGGYPNYIG